MTANVSSVPAWSGMGITKNLGVNRVLFSDPSVFLDTNLRLGWYAGNKYQPHLQDDISRIIKKITLNSQKIVLFGPSGGGYAALHQGSKIPGSTVVASNPQTDIYRYLPLAVKRYNELAWGQDYTDKSSPYISSVLEAYSQKIDTSIIYIQNSGDQSHVENHLKPFLEKIHPENRLLLTTPFFGPGHIGPSKEFFENILDKICYPDSWNSLQQLISTIQVESPFSAKKTPAPVVREPSQVKPKQSPATKKKLFIGRTRFSLFNPTSSSWLASNGSKYKTPEEYRDYLYSENRLDLRAEIFINQSLPQINLSAQKHNIKHIVSYSESLPIKYKEKLKEAGKKYPFLVLDEVAPGKSSISPQKLATKIASTDEIFAIYRLDDDDILSSEYFDSSADYLKQEFVGMSLSFGKGYSVLGDGYGYTHLKISHRPFNSVGLLNICQLNQDGSVAEATPVPHHLSDTRNPTLVDSRYPVYFQVRHLEQDTSVKFSREEAKNKIIDGLNRLPDVDSYEDFVKRFPFVNPLIRHKNVYVPALEGKPLDNETRIFEGTLKNNFEIEFEAEFNEECVKKQALFKFVLKEADSESIEKAKQVFGLSKDKNIGFFKYMVTVPGSYKRVYRIELPEGVTLSAIYILKRSGGVITPSKCKITSWE